MTDTYDRAVDRVRDEMAKHHDDPGVCAVGEVLTALLAAAPQYAEALLDEKKSVAEAYKALEAYARKHRGKSSCVYVPQDTAEKVILEYYGLKPGKSTGIPAAATPSGISHSKFQSAVPSLDDLLASCEAGLSPSASAAPGETRGPAEPRTRGGILEGL